MTPLSRSQGFTDRLLRSHRTSRDPLHRGAWGPRQFGRHTGLPASSLPPPTPFLSLGSFIHSAGSHHPPHTPLPTLWEVTAPTVQFPAFS